MFYFYHQISFFYFRNQISSSESLTKEAMPGSQIHSLLKYSFIPFSLHHLTVNLSQGRVSRGDGGGAGVCDADSWDSDGSAMDFSRVWWLERRLDWVCDGSLSFFFFFPSFSLVALLRLVSFAGFCFCFLYVPFFSHRMTLVSILTLLFWKLRIEHVGK